MSDHCEKDTANKAACQGITLADVAEVFGGDEPLKLVSSRKNQTSKIPFKKLVCPNPILVRGEYIIHAPEGDLYRSGMFSCGSWSCPVCGKRNKAKFRKRLYQAVEAYSETLPTDRRTKYAYKFLTLTCPGNDYRALTTPEKCLEEMKKNLNRLMTATKKKYGKFEYVWVREFHNGWPHLHLLLMGVNVAPKSILDHIRNLWMGHYGMGTIELNWIRNGLRGVCNYLLKYISKGYQAGSKKSKLYSMSRLLCSLSKLKKYPVTLLKLEFGKLRLDGIVDWTVYKEAKPEILFRYQQKALDTYQGEKAFREEQMPLWKGGEAK